MTFGEAQTESSCPRFTTRVPRASEPAGACEAAPGASSPPHPPAPGAARATEPPPTCAQPAFDPSRGSPPAYARATPGTVSLGRAPRRRSPSSARQPAGSSSGRSSSGGSSGRSPGGGGGGGGGGRARAMAGAGSGSQAGPRRAAPRAPGERSAPRAPRNARVRSQEIRARKGCDPGGRLWNRGGGPSLAMPGDAGRSDPRESGRTGPGGSQALESSEPDYSGRRAGAGGRKWW